MRSAIFKGVIRHKRRDAVNHNFQYPLFMVYLDLDEFDSFFRLSRFWSRNRFNWASFYREDYLRPEVPDLKAAVTQEIKDKTGCNFNGRIFILSHLRYLGVCFNPATFYYCFEEDQLKYVVTEVTNTPWKERHVYVLRCHSNDAVHIFSTKKEFHVSPFLDMNMEYRWTIETPSDNLRLRITNYQDGNQVFTAALSLKRQQATTSNLNKILIEFPAVTIKTVSAIYWQALRLWLKGAKFNNHPHTTEDQVL